MRFTNNTSEHAFRPIFVLRFYCNCNHSRALIFTPSCLCMPPKCPCTEIPSSSRNTKISTLVPHNFDRLRIFLWYFGKIFTKLGIKKGSYLYPDIRLSKKNRFFMNTLYYYKSCALELSANLSLSVKCKHLSGIMYVC